MHTRLEQIGYVILLCDDLQKMKSFYQGLLAFPVVMETDAGITFDTGSFFLGLRRRTRHYDGRTASAGPGIQLAFLVPPVDVDSYYNQLVDQGIKICDSPCNQAWGHRTVYFLDPEGNLLEIYGELNGQD